MSAAVKHAPCYEKADRRGTAVILLSKHFYNNVFKRYFFGILYTKKRTNCKDSPLKLTLLKETVTLLCH
jgi:hypothetical protein